MFDIVRPFGGDYNSALLLQGWRLYIVRAAALTGNSSVTLLRLPKYTREMRRLLGIPKPREKRLWAGM